MGTADEAAVRPFFRGLVPSPGGTGHCRSPSRQQGMDKGIAVNSNPQMAQDLLVPRYKTLDAPPGAWQLTVEGANATQLQSVKNMLIWIAYRVS